MRAFGHLPNLYDMYIWFVYSLSDLHTSERATVRPHEESFLVLTANGKRSDIDN